jgi:hypothetical protein
MGEIIKPLETKYIHNPHCREYILFPEEYFSGSQVSIFFSHKHIVDCSSFSFMLQEQHKPIYSYADRTFKEMAIGNRIVIGTFKVAFQEAGRLNAILNEIEEYRQDTNDAVAMFTGGQEEIPAWMSEAGFSPELLLGMAIKNDPSIKDTDIIVVQLWWKNKDSKKLTRYWPFPSRPFLLRGAADGEDYAFIAIRDLIGWLGFNASIGQEYITEEGLYVFTHSKDINCTITVNDKANPPEIYYNGEKVIGNIPKKGSPLMTFKYQDVVYVHVRPICELMGYKVVWKKKDRIVEVSWG